MCHYAAHTFMLCSVLVHVRERERDRGESERLSEREGETLTRFAHVHRLYISFQHAQQWLLVWSKVVKLILCRCKTVNKKKQFINNTIHITSIIMTSSQGEGEKGSWHLGLLDSS